MRGARRWRRAAARGLAAGGLAALAAGAAGWVASDRLEQHNDFCTRCHLEPGLPLHRDLRRDYDAVPAVSLAGRHGGARLDGRGAGAEAAFRCIDCHGGTGLRGRVRVKALAARDAFWYVVGRFGEPDEMRWPLWDEDCRKCHAGFDEGEPAAGRAARFHELPVHNVELGVSCVGCHLVHDGGGDPDAFFLHAAWVRSQCARCHAEFTEEGVR